MTRRLAIDARPSEETEPALLLVSRGSPDPVGRESALALAERIREAAPGRAVAVAFMAYGGPGLAQAIAQLAEQGAGEVVAVPLAAHGDRLMTTGLRRALRRAARLRPEVRLRLAPNLERLPDLVRLLLDAAHAGVVLRPSRDPEDIADIAERLERVRPPANRRHVLFCTSSPCIEEGAAELYTALRDQMAAVSEAYPERRVQVTRSTCLGVCGIAPAMVVYPEATWYGRLDAATLERIAREHLIGGCPVAGLARHPSAAAEARA